MPNPPVELVLGRKMKRWGCLLVAGGLLDQPARLWRDIEAALEEEELFYLRQKRLQSAFQELQAKESAQE